jgi:CSLREA domain-containing protein
MVTYTPSPIQTIALVIGVLLALLAAPIHAATFSVGSGSDGADVSPGDGVCDADAGAPVSCTLRAAIQEANATPAPDVVELLARTAPYLLTLDGTGPTAGELILSADVTIVGSGAGRSRVLAVWEKAFGGRILNVAAGVNVSLTGIGLMGGEACGDGGAILNNGSLVIDSVTVRANLGERGGAISNVGTLMVMNSTLVQNRSVLIDDDPDAESCRGNNQAGGGAIHNTGTLDIVNTTLAGNSAAAAGGALLNDGAGTAALRYVTVHDNGASPAIAGAAPVAIEATILSGSPACNPAVALTSLGANVVGDATCDGSLLGAGDVGSIDPALAPLVWLNGAAFHEPTAASPAIDRAGQCISVSHDQLKRPRPHGAACDAGSIEVTPLDTAPNATMWRGHRCTIVGTPADDLLRGTPGRDVICGLEGDDTLIGFAGNDLLVGGRGSDILKGGKGKDSVYGEWGHDRLLGGRGRDSVYGEKGRDILMGGRGPDRLLGGKGRDFLNGGNGHDVIRGGPGRDRARFDRAFDRVAGIEPWASRKLGKLGRKTT